MKMYIFQSIRYASGCGSYYDILDRGLPLTRKLLTHFLDRGLPLTRKLTDKISQQPENCENRNDPDLVQAFLKKWWVESDFKSL
jgi:hypothetical protein